MSEKMIRRYTDMPTLVYLLKNKQITLLDPNTWDDKNDSCDLAILKGYYMCTQF